MNTIANLFLGLFASMILMACTSKKPNEQIAQLPGYWEIESVTMPDGSLKTFSVSNSIDFIEVTGDSGLRKKLMPKLDGSYRKFVGGEQFFMEIEGDSLYLHYKTPYAHWTEVVLEANEKELIVKNQGNRTYKYTRHEPINILEDE